MIAHIVLFTPKTALTADEARSFAQSVTSVVAQSPSVARAFVGRSIDVDPGYARSFGDKTYRFAAVLEFSDQSRLVEYLASDAHGAMGALFWQYCESAQVAEVEYRSPSDPDVVEFLLNDRTNP